MYHYPLPSTSSISFSDFCIDQSSHRSYLSTHIPEATQTRANFRAVLKQINHDEQSRKDYLNLVKVIEEYLPNLLSIINCAAHDEIGFKVEPTFTWRTALSGNFFQVTQKLSLPGLHADLTFTLLTYAFALCGLARTIVNSLGTYEHDRSISDAERKKNDDQLNVAVNFLCKASGIFSYINDKVLTEWEVNRAGGLPVMNKPPELTREVNSALAKMVLSDAQTLAIRKLLSKSAYDNNITPGPPLPKSHPSPALLAKLHLECASLYSSARALMKTSKDHMGPSSDGHLEILSDLRRYLSDEAGFHGALGRKWLGVDAGENGGMAKGGEGVAFLSLAKKELEEVKNSKKVNIAKINNKDDKATRKERWTDELSSINIFYKHYKKMNDSLHFQPVPSHTELQSRIPAGRLAIAAKPYVTPALAFGPGSVDYVARRTEDLDISDDSEVRSPPASRTSVNYAGAGSYY